MTHAELKLKALAKNGVRSAYETLEPEFTLLHEFLQARHQAGLSQAEVAIKMGTKAPAVTRLESSLMNGSHSPSLATLKKYAEALGFELKIKLVRQR